MQNSNNNRSYNHQPCRMIDPDVKPGDPVSEMEAEYMMRVEQDYGMVAEEHPDGPFK